MPAWSFLIAETAEEMLCGSMLVEILWCCLPEELLNQGTFCFGHEIFWGEGWSFAVSIEQLPYLTPVIVNGNVNMEGNSFIFPLIFCNTFLDAWKGRASKVLKIFLNADKEFKRSSATWFSLHVVLGHVRYDDWTNICFQSYLLNVVIVKAQLICTAAVFLNDPILQCADTGSPWDSWWLFQSFQEGVWFIAISLSIKTGRGWCLQ